jgi:cytochrome c-type biogenesis protein CcmF
LVSREAAVIGNNVLLLAATAIILVGTVFPLVAEAVSGARLSVGQPYFVQAVAPVFLLLLLLLGTAPLLPWRSASPARSLPRLRVPVSVAALVLAGAALAGAGRVEPVVGLGLAALVLVTNGQEIVMGLRFSARRRGLRGALGRGAGRPGRSYGGLLVHVGLAVMAAGIVASGAFAQQSEVTLKRGDSAVFAGHRVEYLGLTTAQQPQRTVLTTRLRVTETSTGRSEVLDPRLNLYPAASEPIGSPSIDRGPVWDMYASVIGLQDNGGSATIRLYRNPGVNWVWLGALVMVVGGVVSGRPRRTRARPARSAGRSAAGDAARPVPATVGAR